MAALSCGPNSGTVSTSINQITNILCVTYSANANFNGSDSVCVVVCDNGVPNLCDTTKIKITVTPVNDPPVANNDVYSTNEDVTLNVPAVTGVLSNDSDPIDGTAVTVTGLVGTPTGGTVTLNANGSFTFVPTPNFTGAASFCYRIEDSGTPTPALADTACVTINVVPVNDTPDVPDTTITQCEDCGPISVCLPITNNDLGQTLNIAETLCGPNSGSSTPSIVGTTLCVTYTPNPNFNGNDSVCIVVCDNGSPVLCDTTKIKITVTPVNDPPVANNDTYNTNENQTLNVATPGILSNDSDPIDGTAVTVTGLVGTPTGGTVTLNANGSFTFVPTSNFNGVATFCYRIEDSGTPTPALADTACVTINVNQVNYPPVIPDTTVTTCEDCPITVCVPYTDQDLTDAHTVTLACLPTLGTVSGINLNQVTDILCFNYTPSTNVNGVESICFVVCDNGVPQLCDTSNVTINVTPVNDPPYADTINVVLFENTSIGVNVSAATGDLEGNPLTYTYGAVSPANGTYTITGTGAIVVTPNPNFVGTFSIPYAVCDLSPFPVNVLCDNAAIIVTVLPTSDTLVNHAPIANNDYVTTPQNTGIVVNQLANDYDVDGDVLQVTINNVPNNGSFTVNANGTINYIPNSGFFGFDTIGYTICDPTALNNPKPLCDNAIIVIYVSRDTTSTTNDAPVAVDDFATICSNESVTLRLLLNDSDPNGDALSVVTIIDNVNNGILTSGSLGVYLYAPNSGFNGNDTLIYRICDNGSPVLCDTAIAVVKVNGSPIITPSIASLNNCSGDSVNITFSSSVSGTTFTWTASNGTSGIGNIQTVLVNNGTFTQNVLYTVIGVAPGGCASTTLNIPVSVKPRSIATASQNTTIVCSGENVVINANSSIPGTTFTWSATNGASGSGAIITNNPINTGTSNITVTYSILPLTNGCTGDTLKIDITVKPNPSISLNPTTQTICSGAPITINASSSVPGTTFTWNGTNGNSGTGSVINDSPVNNQVGNIVVTYTINAQFNGCNATTVTSLVTVRPNPIASAGLDKTLQNCPSAIVSIGTVPAAAGGTAPYSFSWSPATGLSSTTIGNPNVQVLTNNTLYTLLVTDANNCSATDQVLVTVAPSILVAEAGNGGELCSNALNGIQIGGIPSAVAGNPPFVYSWIPSAGLNNPASSNPIAKPDTTTKYQLTVTDAFGCVATDTVVVIINNAPIAFAGLDTFLCQGNCVQLGGQPTVVGGTGAISYNWSPTLALSSAAVANPLACPAQTSTYFVTATDSKACAGTSFVVLVVYQNPIADAGPDKIISECFADTIQIGSSPTATGGQAPYTYTWSPAISLSSDTISNPLVSGLLVDQLYTLVVTDDFKCSATDQALVTVVPTSLQVDAGNVGFLCAGGIDSVTLGGLPTVTGGLGPYKYTWSPVLGLSDASASNPKARPTSTTTYYVTVVDALGCSQVDSTTITINPSITVNAGTTQTVCAGATVNIGGAPSASGGSGVYTYLWSPSASVANITAANTTATPLTSETYTLLVTDNQGCSATASVLINVNANPIAQAGADKTLVRCPGDSVIIGDLPAAIGGTGPYTYSWSPAGGLSSTTVANPIVKGLNLDRNYTLTVTDANGCSSTDAVTVIVQQNTLFANAGPNRAICSGVASCTTLGTATAAIGGTLPYTYVWTGGGLNDSTISNPIACNIPTTTYNLFVTDSKGCTSSSSVVVTVNPTPVANAGVDTAICAGSSVQIGGNPTATVGNAPFTYQWSPTTGLSAANVSNPLATPTITTTYNVTVTSSNGCTATDGILVTIRSRPVVNAGADKSLVACVGDTVRLGAIPVVISGGTAPYTYLWSPNANLSSATVQNPFITGLATTTSYQVVVTDVFGCQGNDFAIVNVVSSTLQANAGTASNVCAGAGSAVNLGGAPTATGGSSPYLYTWAASAGGFTSSLANPTVIPTGSTTYYVTVTDSKGCIAVDSITINQNASPSVLAGTDTTICSGFCMTLGNNATSGKTPYQYNWTPTLGLNANNIAQPLACPLVTTVYSVLVTDSNGCQATSQINITVRPNPVANAGVDQSLISCLSDTIIIGGTPAASGGTPGYTYTWSPATALSSANIANPRITGLALTQSYSLLVTDASGCTATDAVLVTVVPSSVSAEAGNGGQICAGSGNTVTLGGAPTAANGTGPYTFTWSSPSTLNLSTIANPIASPTATITYFVTVSDSKGCFAVDSTVVIVNPAPVACAGNDTAICSGAKLRLGCFATASGGTAPYTYLWSNGSQASNPQVGVNVTTIFTVTVTDASGCTASDAITVTVNPNPIANAGPDRNVVACSADSVQLGGSPAASGGSAPFTYLWTPAGGLTDTAASNPFVKGLGSTSIFTLTVRDLNGCTASDQVLVNVLNPTIQAQAGNNVAFCQGALGSIILGGSPTAIGGTVPFTYAWSSVPAGFTASNANPVASPAQTTTYSVIVTDAGGCVATDTVRITINPRPVVFAGVPDTVCAGECIQLGGSPTSTGGTGPKTYNWTPAIFLSASNVANPIACPTNNVTYLVTATDSLGCNNNASVTIRVNQNPVASAGLDQTLISCVNACATLGGSPTSTNGTSPYLYAWSPANGLNNSGLSNPTACNLSTSVNYVLTVTDNNGCTSTDAVAINVVQSTLVANAGNDRSICAGQTSGITIGGSPAVSGGSLPYSIEWAPVQGILNSNTIANPLVNPTDTTSYILVVQDAQGCIAIDSMVVFANPAVTAVVGNDTSFCNGSFAQLGGSPATGSGGTAPYTYFWSPGTGLSSINASNPVASPTSTTSYCVTVTDAVGCSSSTCQNIAVNSSIIANAGPDQTIVSCAGAFAQLGGTPPATGGSGNYSYSWSPSANLSSTSVPSPFTINLTTTTLFTVTVTDLATGCSTTDQVLISVVPSTLAVDAGLNRVYCSNSSTGVQIGGAPTAIGGQLPYTYQWNTGVGLSDANIANPIATPSVTTKFTVTVTDGFGCSQVDSVTVIVSSLITVNAGADTAICTNTSLLLGGSPVVSGGVAPYTYSWTP